MRFRLHASILLICLSLTAAAQRTPSPREFCGLCDSLRVGMKERTSVDLELSVTKVNRKGKTLDIYFSSDLSYYPLHDSDVRWLREQIENGLESISAGLKPGKIFTNRYELSDLAFPVYASDGQPSGFSYKTEDPRRSTPRFIEKVSAPRFSKGLSDRYIALWQSHGRYYDETHGIWQWQRACLHRTVEDMFTQSFVLPLLIPMLENSGAYVMTPRERDIQWREIITDNDKSFSDTRSGKLRRQGSYCETGSWSDAGQGFADFKEAYTFSDNPFTAGSARMAKCSGTRPTASVSWTPEIEERGQYAVYISYKTLPESTDAARYTVHHLGGDSEFKVNQQRGGGTWIYLGTFEFAEGSDGYVTLDNRGSSSSVVTADAVKIGGGMGKLQRGGQTSGMASSAEGAHYWMQWAGVDSSITCNWDTDYTNDYASRGRWTQMMTEQKQIPFDLSLAFHTDAGIAPSDSTVGTLAIYTLRNEGEREFSDGRDRIISRLLCDYVQSQVVDDIRDGFDPDWSRRGLCDRSYSECRTPGVPAMILELLSHQNLADMRYGLDPAFRFTVCRAVYKGILKTLSEFYGCTYVVQPLPVNSFSTSFCAPDSLRLEWKPTADKREATAVSNSYLVYTRVDDGAFDCGRPVSQTHMTLPLERGHIYSFKVVACNDGGMSFPSEILSAGIPASNDKPAVVIVNNFNKISAPEIINGAEYAGFDGRKDGGVPYLQDISYIGENYEFRRTAEYVDDVYPGFGASYDNHAGEIIAGNSFDYPYMHGLSIIEAGYPFYSMSADAFCASCQTAYAADIICGKQGRIHNSDGNNKGRYIVFPEALQTAIRKFTRAGGNVLVSGSNIASDGQDDSSERTFAETVLGFKLSNAYGTDADSAGGMKFSHTPNSSIYCVECPDGLSAAGKGAAIWMRYANGRTGAAVYFNGDGYKAVSMGVPVETFTQKADRDKIFRSVLEYFDGGSKPVDHNQVD